MYDIFYIGDNAGVKENYPFAKQVSDESSIKPKTTLYWLIEPNTEILDYDVLEYTPKDYDKQYEHVWKWNNNNYGGVRLLPKKVSKGIKEINQVVCKKKFDILYTVTPEDYFVQHPYATHVWCVDPDYKLNDNINWAPDNFEPDFIHCFHLKGQLEHKYPEREGGIKLFPKNWKQADNKFHSFLDANVTYPVLYVKNVEDYAQRNIFDDEYVWLIDVQHKFNLDTVDWVPSPFEDNMIHVFRMPYQLTEKYPMAMGGIRLVPKKWKQAETKIHPACPIEDENYDVFYVDEDEFTSDVYSEYAERSRTDWFWIVDRDFTFNGKLLYVPAKHEREFIHVFKIPGHLEERYPNDYTDAWDNRCGGVRLVHKEFDFTKHKYQKDIVPVRYDIFYTDNINDFETHARKSKTKMFWLVDSEHELNEVFKYVPQRYDQKAIQIFKIPNQLDHKYPKSVTNVSDNRCGGVKLVPVKYDKDNVKYIASNPTSDKSYPVIKVSNVDEYTDVFQDCWIVDSEYEINQKIEWAPPLFQRNCIHTFHVGEQLRHKYPESMGGLRWVPVDWNGDIVIHSELLNAIPEYPIYYQDDPSINPDKDHSCWVADKSYRLDESIKWAPSSFDTDKVHVFHIHNQLTNKYPEEMGGLYWYPDNEVSEIKIHKDPLYVNAKTFTVKRVLDPTDFSIATEDCWLVDQDYVLEDSDFDFVPWQNENEKEQIHVYQVRGQLEHKYPEEMGGIYWVPANHKDINYNIHDVTPFGEQLSFPVFDSEDEGRTKSNNNWFWVIDKDVEVDSKFDFNFVPKIWDNGKTHVWQKLNPITGKQYDYGGVMLCPKVPQTKGRPKYIREVCSTQKEYPVYYMSADDVKNGIEKFYKNCAEQTETNMFWVVDYCVQVCESFDFSYYPTQWDIKNVHVWQNESGEHTDIRLCPTTLFLDDVTEEQIVNNTFDNLKLIPKQASETPEWNVYTFDDTPLKQQLIDFAEQDSNAYFWTVDSNVDTYDNWNAKFKPAVENADKVHVWQKLNPRTGNVHAYGGVRLWPNPFLDAFKPSYSSDDIKLSKTARGKLQYVKDALCVSKQYDIVFLSYKEEGSSNAYERLTARFNATWVKDIKGIFNAHKEAANRVNSDLFWVVDADADISEDFDFSYIPDVYDEEVVHVWASKNPVTGEEYGYGGVKLFNRQQILDATSWGLDFTTGLSNRFKAMPEISCTTRFNTDAFSTWRSAFRECVKLTLSDDPDSEKRLESWLHPIPDADFRHDAKRGAEEGKAFALKNKNNLTELNKINDYDWLEEQWNQLN